MNPFPWPRQDATTSWVSRNERIDRPWGSGQILHEAGADLAFTDQGDQLLKRVQPLVNLHRPGADQYEADVTPKMPLIDAAFARAQGTEWGPDRLSS